MRHKRVRQFRNDRVPRTAIGDHQGTGHRPRILTAREPNDALGAIMGSRRMLEIDRLALDEYPVLAWKQAGRSRFPDEEDNKVRHFVDARAVEAADLRLPH